MGLVPHLVEYCRCIFFRESLLIECGIPAAHHVEQNAEAGIVVRHMRCPRPVLRPQAPAVAVIHIVHKLGHTVVLHIKEDDVHPQFRLLLLYLACHLQQHPHPTGTVIGTIHGRMVVLFVRIIVCPRTAVPMGTQQQPFPVLRLIAADDVAHLQGGTVKGIHHIALLVHQCAEVLQLLHQVVATCAVRLTVGHTGTECHLTGHIRIRTVGIELRHIHHTGHFRFRLGGRPATHSAATDKQQQQSRPHRIGDCMYLHSHFLSLFSN